MAYSIFAYLGICFLIFEVVRYIPTIKRAIRARYTQLVEHLRSLGEDSSEASSVSISASTEAFPLGVLPMNTANQTIGIDQTATLRINGAKDVASHALEQLPNILNWSLDNASYGSLSVAADTLSAQFSPSGQLGTVTVTAVTNTDPNASDAPLNVVGTFVLNLVAGKAVVLDLSIEVADSGADAAALAPAPTPVASAPVDAPAPAPVDTTPVVATPAPAPADPVVAAPVEAPAPAPVDPVVADPTPVTTDPTTPVASDPAAPVSTDPVTAPAPDAPVSTDPVVSTPVADPSAPVDSTPAVPVAADPSAPVDTTPSAPDAPVTTDPTTTNPDAPVVADPTTPTPSAPTSATDPTTAPVSIDANAPSTGA